MSNSVVVWMATTLRASCASAGLGSSPFLSKASWNHCHGDVGHQHHLNGLACLDFTYLDSSSRLGPRYPLCVCRSVPLQPLVDHRGKDPPRVRDVLPDLPFREDPYYDGPECERPAAQDPSGREAV